MFQKVLFGLLLISFVSLKTMLAQTYVNASALGANDGSTWENAYTNLDTALAKTKEGEIWIARGVYRHDGPSPNPFRTFQISSQVDLYGGFAGFENSIDQRDLQSNTTILSADYNGDDIPGEFGSNKDDNSYHVITVDSMLSEPVFIDGLTISGGNTSDDIELSQYGRRGGGIYSWSTIVVNQCTFSGNYANAGASIFVDPTTGGGSGTMIMNNLFSQNRATSRGAGFYFYEISNVLIEGNTFLNNSTARGCIYPFRSDSVRISGNVFRNNVGVFDDVSSTGVYNFRSTNVIIEDCEFIENSAANGTAIYFDADSLMSAFENNLVVSNCLFEGNVATGNFSAGIYLWQGVGVRIENCTFKDNAAGNGGAIYQDGRFQVLREDNVIVENCSFIGNSASGTGGAYRSFQSNTIFKNCEFVENVSSLNGGAIYHLSGSYLTVDSCSFISNEANVGGAIAITESQDVDLDARLYLRNTIMQHNSANDQGGAINTVGADVGIVNSLLASNFNIDGNLGGALAGLAGGNSDSMFISILNATIASNIGPVGAGIGFSTNGDVADNIDTASIVLTLQNTILANENDNFIGLAGSPHVISMGGNVVTDNSLDDSMDFNDQDILNTEQSLFVSNSHLDFHLTDNSPAINIGQLPAPEFDIEGSPRVNAPDAGCYEYQLNVSVNQDLDEVNRTLSISPNPVREGINLLIENEWIGGLIIKLYDIDGQLNGAWKFNKNTASFLRNLSVAHINPGLYILQVSNGSSLLTRKFVKMP